MKIHKCKNQEIYVLFLKHFWLLVGYKIKNLLKINTEFIKEYPA